MPQIVPWLRKSRDLAGKWDVCRSAEKQLLDVTETERVSGILPSKFEREVVEHFCLREWALHLDDVMIRRSGWHYYFVNRRDMAEQVAKWMGELIGWTKELKESEIARYEQMLADTPTNTGNGSA